MQELRSPEKTGLRNAVINNISLGEVHTASGVFLGTYPTYNVDLRRLNGLIDKLFMGLYYHLKGQQLPTVYKVSSLYVPSLLEAETDEIKQYVAFAKMAMSGTCGKLGRDVFNYGIRFCDDDPDAFVGFICFYTKVSFVCTCIRQGGGVLDGAVLFESPMM